MELLCFGGRVFREEIIPANAQNMVSLYKNLFEDPRKQINTKILMPMNSMVEKTIRLKTGKNWMPELKTNMSLLVINN